MKKNIFQKSILGVGRKYSFSTLLRYAEKGELNSVLNDEVPINSSFIELSEDRKLNTRKYKEQMSKNKMKIKIREK